MIVYRNKKCLSLNEINETLNLEGFSKSNFSLCFTYPEVEQLKKHLSNKSLHKVNLRVKYVYCEDKDQNKFIIPQRIDSNKFALLQSKEINGTNYKLTYKKIIRENLRKEMIEKGITEAELSKVFQVTKGAPYQVLQNTDDSSSLSAEDLLYLRKFFNIKPNDILNTNDIDLVNTSLTAEQKQQISLHSNHARKKAINKLNTWFIHNSEDENIVKAIDSFITLVDNGKVSEDYHILLKNLAYLTTDTESNSTETVVKKKGSNDQYTDVFTILQKLARKNNNITTKDVLNYIDSK